MLRRETSWRKLKFRHRCSLFAERGSFFCRQRSLFSSAVIIARSNNFMRVIYFLIMLLLWKSFGVDLLGCLLLIQSTFCAAGNHNTNTVKLKFTSLYLQQVLRRSKAGTNLLILVNWKEAYCCLISLKKKISE